MKARLLLFFLWCSLLSGASAVCAEESTEERDVGAVVNEEEENRVVVLRSYRFPASHTMTFAIENRIYSDPVSLQHYEEAQLTNNLNAIEGKAERILLPPVVRCKNSTALILDPLLTLPVFNPQNRAKTGEQTFRVRAVSYTIW